MTVEDAEQLASSLLLTAELLGKCINEIQEAEKAGADSVLREQEASEKLQLDGPEVCSALRALAMRLDRAALIKLEPTWDALGLLHTAVDSWHAQNQRIVQVHGRKQASVWLPLEWMYSAAALAGL